MDRLDSLQLFTRIVELRSFSAAAIALDVPRATATHAIKQLEARLGTRLLERTTRQVRPTLDGQAFYERCIHVLSELDDAENALRHVAANPRGILRVNMAGVHARSIVLPKLGEFHQRYPDINLLLSSSDRLIDLVGEGVDCVIRAGVPKDSSLVARRLAVMPQVICASPGYLETFGTPKHPDELVNHKAVGFFALGSKPDFDIELMVAGERRSFTLGGWIVTDDAENYRICALQGYGLAQMPRYRIASYLQAGTLREVLSDWPSPAMPLSAIYPSQRQLSPRVRVWIDWLSQLYQEHSGELEAGSRP